MEARLPNNALKLPNRAGPWVNYFIAILGELLQRMDDASARYSIALPNIRFRGLWARLPHLAKSRPQISALFVDGSGRVEEIQFGDPNVVEAR